MIDTLIETHRLLTAIQQEHGTNFEDSLDLALEVMNRDDIPQV